MEKLKALWNDYKRITETGFDRPGTSHSNKRRDIDNAIATAEMRIKAIEADALSMALRLLGEDESTFSPDVAEVMDRWRPLSLAALDYAAKHVPTPNDDVNP